MSSGQGYQRRSRPKAKIIQAIGAVTVEADAAPDHGETRPKTRGECKDGVRPCPWASCRYHLMLDVNPGTGTITLNFPELELEELTETCALDVADRGEHQLDEVGALMNVSRARTGQVIESLARNPDLRAAFVVALGGAQ